jgi:hypothetical protein
MPLTISPERFAAIRKAVLERRMENLAVEIAAATDWDKQPHFSDVDDFMRYADTFLESSETPPRRSPKRPND